MLPATTADVTPATAQLWLMQTLAVQRLSRLPLPMPLLFVDVETTRDRIVEIAMVRFAPGHVPWVSHTYVQPGTVGWGRSARYWNTAVHGVTPAMVAHRPTFASVAGTVSAALQGATLVGHNVAFERRFLREELKRVGGTLSSPTLCTLRLARDLLPGLDTYKLADLAARFDVRNPAPHRALGDTFTSLWVMLAMLERHAGPRPLEQHVREAIRTADRKRLNPWTR